MLIIEAERVTESLFSSTIENIVEDFLVSVTDELVFKDTLALVAPETDQEQLLSNLLLKVVTLLNNGVFVLGSN